MFFIRHGQSTFNEGFDTTGLDPQTPDAPLSSLGVKQVEASATKLVGKAINAIISSPYTRALQTASIIARAIKAPIIVEPLVGERRLYSCDIGTHAAQLIAAWPDVDFSRLPEDSEWWMPFHEKGSDVARRVQAFRDEWAWQKQADRTLVVSHWYFINAATGAFADNAEVVEVR